MRRGRPFLNRHTLQKEMEISDASHSTNLRLIRPTMRAADHDSVCLNNRKGDQMRQAREQQIDRDNRILLDKIATTINRSGEYSPSRMAGLRTGALTTRRSLNLADRRQRDRQINQENQRIASRLQSRRATLDLQKLRREWCDNQQVIERRSNRNFYLATLRPHDHALHARPRPQRLQLARVNKVYRIDGCTMKIRAEFAREFFKITADCLNGSDLKLIEIPREEALYFIQNECHGKIEELVDKLKYDHLTDALYLASESLVEDTQQNPETQQDRLNIKARGRSKAATNADRKEQGHKETSIDDRQIHYEPKEEAFELEPFEAREAKEEERLFSMLDPRLTASPIAESPQADSKSCELEVLVAPEEAKDFDEAL